MPNNYNTQLLDFMAKACHYAQEHIGDDDAWGTDNREQLLQCVSFQMACFLCQNTVKGKEGVDWDVVLCDLVDTDKNKSGMMVKSVDNWKKILGKIVDDLGGWKKK